MSIEAMKRWLNALEESSTYNDTMEFHDRKNRAIKEMREAIAQAEQAQPVAYILQHSAASHKKLAWNPSDNCESVPLYTAPPAPKPLTDDQILHRVQTHVGGVNPGNLDNSDWINFARAVEAAHGIKE